LTVDDTPGMEYMLCFFSDKEINILEVKKWLEAAKLEQYTSENTGGVAIVSSQKSQEKPPASFYLIYFRHEKK
jgi:hypothetical protein